METRKAQLTGGSTFTVSLPKEWANETGLETGDALRLFPRDDTVILELVDGADADWQTEVDVEAFSETELRRAIEALYTTGFDRITLSGSPDLGEDRRVIAAAARKYIGLETLESTDRRVKLRSLLDSGTVSVGQSTVQLKQVALSMHADAVRSLLDGDDGCAEHVIERDGQVDRLYAMISRHFQRSLVTLRETEQLDLDQSELYEYQTTARQLERVADHAEKLADLATQFETPPEAFADEIASHAGTAREIVAQATSAVVGDDDVGTAHDALDRRDELTASLEELGRDLHEREVPESHLIALTFDSVGRTAEYGGNIAETALQTAARDRRF